MFNIEYIVRFKIELEDLQEKIRKKESFIISEKEKGKLSLLDENQIKSLEFMIRIMKIYEDTLKENIEYADRKCNPSIIFIDKREILNEK